MLVCEIVESLKKKYSTPVCIILYVYLRCEWEGKKIFNFFSRFLLNFVKEEMKKCSEVETFFKLKILEEANMISRLNVIP